MGNRKVTKSRKEASEARWQTHVYLSEADYTLLKAIADRDSRSLTMQIQHFIRQGIAAARKP
jgi:hypothetical protein